MTAFGQKYLTGDAHGLLLTEISNTYISVFRDSTSQTEEVRFGILELSTLFNRPPKNIYIYIFFFFAVLFNSTKGLSFFNTRLFLRQIAL